MNKKNYINRPIRVSSLITKIFKPLKKKYNPVVLEIKANWFKIVGPEIAEKCEISNLKVVNNKKVLLIKSDHSNLFELSYSSETILRKINEFNPAFKINSLKFKKFLQKS